MGEDDTAPEYSNSNNEDSIADDLGKVAKAIAEIGTEVEGVEKMIEGLVEDVEKMIEGLVEDVEQMVGEVTESLATIMEEPFMDPYNSVPASGDLPCSDA